MNEVDELSMKRLIKETEFSKVVLGNGILNYQKIKCTNCNLIFTEFNKEYSNILNDVVPSCPDCAVDIYNHIFLPLDNTDKVIK